MANIYIKNGQSVYDSNGATYDAKTGQVVSGEAAPYDPFASGRSVSTGVSNSPVITTQSLQPAQPIQLPTPPQNTTNYDAILAGAKAQAESIQKGIDSLSSASAPVTAPKTDTTDPGRFTKLLETLKSYMPKAPGSSADAYNAAYKGANIDQYTDDLNQKNAIVQSAKSKVSAIDAKLEGLDAELKVQNLKTEGQGGAITARGVANAQQANSREIAIRKLPLEAEKLSALAEVATAQGDAELAQNILAQAEDRLKTTFTLQQKDAEDTYKYQLDLYNSILDQATKEQTQQIADKKQELASNQTNLNDARNFAQQLSVSAMTNGQASLASAIASIIPPDVNSKTFASDLQKYTEQVAALQAKIMKTTSSSEKTVPEYEKKNKAYNDINQLLKMKNPDGVPYTDTQGYFTIQGFKDIVQAAAADGISRMDIITQYADRVSPYNPKNYGLTPAELTKLGYQ